MTIHDFAKQKFAIGDILEVSVQIGLAALLVIGCLVIMRPFIPLIMWGVIIAIASYPTFYKLQGILGGRTTLAAILWTLMMLAVLIVPLVLMGQSLIDSLRPIIAHVRDGTLALPPPPDIIARLPIIGAPIARTWSAASTDLTATLEKLSPQVTSALPGILSASAGLGSTLLQFLLAILLSGALLANAPAASRIVRSLAIRLFGEEQGPEYQALVGATVRSVTFGIMGVALIQTALAAAGFYLVGLPGASIWSVLFLFAAILQIGALVLIPAAMYGFAVASKTAAVIFLIWCIFVGVIDNVLKPILLGRGTPVPVAVVFLGVIGGFVAMGIVGLFVGAVVLAVGYRLFLAWLGKEPVAVPESGIRDQVSGA